MNITRFTDYALRVLIYLGVNDDASDVPITIKSVAQSYGVSKNHLMKVVQELSAKGYIEATRGKNGGIKLNRKPEQINIGQLVRHFEQGYTLVECFGEENQCVISPGLPTKKMFAGALNQFFNHLEQYSLLDLIDGSQKTQLAQLLVSNQTKDMNINLLTPQ